MQIKRSPLTVLIVIGSCLIYWPLAAQDYRPGYIIKSNADSISGLIRYRGKKNESQCDFKATKKSRRTTYFPSDLMSYGFIDGRQFVSVVLPGPDAPKEKVFARILSDGPMTLYRHGKYFFVKKDELIALPFPTAKIVDAVEIGATTMAERRTDNKMWKKDKRYVSALNMLLADCQMSADKTPYYEKDLTRIVNNYNQCKGVPPREEKVRPLYRLNVGILGGYVSSTLKVKESAIVPFSSTYASFEPSKTVVGGVSFDFSSPRVFDRLFLTVEGWYFDAIYLGKDYRGYTKQDIILDINAIRIFAGARYNFLHESRTPFIKVGLSGTITQDLNLSAITELEYPNGEVFYSDDLDGQLFEKKVKGVWFGVGYDQLVVGKMKAFVEFRYEGAAGYFGTPINTDSKLGNLSFLVGIRF